jgi:hypothetical protein
LAQFFFVQTCAALEGPGEAYLRFFGQYLEAFPVRQIDQSLRADVLRRDRVVLLVERIISLSSQLPNAKTPHDQSSLQSQIAATDRQIDQLVYELYGLTDEEIRIVEGETIEAATTTATEVQRNGKPAVSSALETETLPPDIEAAIAEVEKLDDIGKLREAVVPLMKPKEVKRLEALNRKAQDIGLTDDEESERDDLSHLYDKSMIVRATALAELHKRGEDVNKLIAP